MSSTTVLPEQATALVDLFNDTGAIALDIAETTQWSLLVATYHRNPDDSPEAPPASARWWTVSVNGVVREVAAAPEQVAA